MNAMPPFRTKPRAEARRRDGMAPVAARYALFVRGSRSGITGSVPSTLHSLMT